jgi:CoA:oxalate CoA-transferase
MKASNPLPLAGVRVLDLTQIYNGPYATFLMGCAGADVIKIEPPDGEHLRKRPDSGGVSDPFVSLNANKRCIVLDLKHEQGIALFLALVKSADVVVENFAPGVMDRLGIGPDVLRRTNPAIVYASSSGYGGSGPYRDYPAMDLSVQAISGVLAVTGHAGTAPVKAGNAICDFLAGIHLYAGVMTSLYQRERTGAAPGVEVSMMNAIVPTLASNLGSHRVGDSTLRTGNRHGGLNLVPYNVYPTNNGYMAILTANDRQWDALTVALGCGEMRADPRYATRAGRVRHMESVDAAIAQRTIHYSRQALFDLLIEARVPCAPVRELDEVVHDPHLHATGMWKWIEHPLRGRMLVHGSPLVFDGADEAPYTPSAALGAHTDEVLSEICGLAPEDLGRLRDCGVIN